MGFSVSKNDVLEFRRGGRRRWIEVAKVHRRDFGGKLGVRLLVHGYRLSPEKPGTKYYPGWFSWGQEKLFLLTLDGYDPAAGRAKNLGRLR